MRAFEVPRSAIAGLAARGGYSMRDRVEYRKLLEKRHRFQDEGRLSPPDSPGATVAVLLPFVAGLVQDERDNWDSFARDAELLEQKIVRTRRIPDIRLGATTNDFRDVMGENGRHIPTVVVRAFGSLASINVPTGQGDNFARLSWLGLSRMASHLKKGKFFMRTCAVRNRRFNAPLAAGVVNSHCDIWAAVDHIIRIVGLDDEANALIRPITDMPELSYEDVLQQFPIGRNWRVPTAIPDEVYALAKGIYNNSVNRSPLPKPVYME